MALLEVQEIFCRAGGWSILDGFSLRLEVGEVHALIGANGTGKSALACLVMGCGGHCPAGAQILFEGRRIDELKIYERARLGIAMAWQEPARFKGLSVRVCLSLKNQQVDAAALLTMVEFDARRRIALC